MTTKTCWVCSLPIEDSDLVQEGYIKRDMHTTCAAKFVQLRDGGVGGHDNE